MEMYNSIKPLFSQHYYKLYHIKRDNLPQPIF